MALVGADFDDLDLGLAANLPEPPLIVVVLGGRKHTCNHILYIYIVFFGRMMMGTLRYTEVDPV